MKTAFVRRLRCPACGFAPLFLKTTRGTLDSVQQGALVCERCEQAYRVWEGMPVLRPAAKGHPGRKPRIEKRPFQPEASSDVSRLRRLLALPSHEAMDYFVTVRLLRRLGISASRLLVLGAEAVEQALGLILLAGVRELVLAEEDLEILRRGRERLAAFGVDAPGVACDFTRVPFPDRAFDLVLSDGLLHQGSGDLRTGRLAEQVRTADWVLAAGPERRLPGDTGGRPQQAHPVRRDRLEAWLHAAGAHVAGWESRPAVTRWVLSVRSNRRGFPRIDRWPGVGMAGRRWLVMAGKTESRE